jgi:hypothetical protein
MQKDLFEGFNVECLTAVTGPFSLSWVISVENHLVISTQVLP